MRELLDGTKYAWIFDKPDRWFHRDYGVWREIEEPWFARERSELIFRINAGLVAGGPALSAPDNLDGAL